jgi:SAM-dependent methyltransferase
MGISMNNSSRQSRDETARRASHVEEFKPIPIRRDSNLIGRVGFALRLVVDLQLLTCIRFLRPHLQSMTGSVLDVGCGEMPFRGFLPTGHRYTGIDIAVAGDFGMRQHADIVGFDGLTIPFPDESFDHVLCTEVLEHAENPLALISEMHRVLRHGGTLVATVPFSARVHHAPYDFHRFTRYRLSEMFSNFEDVAIEERGDDLAVIANKLIVVCMRLAKSTRKSIWPLPFLILAGGAATLALAIAHLSLITGLGSRADPLGYGVFARKV